MANPLSAARIAEIEALYAKAKKIGWANDEAFLVHLNNALPELLRLARIGAAVEAAPVATIRVDDGRVSFHFHPLDELVRAGTQRVRIVPVVAAEGD